MDSRNSAGVERKVEHGLFLLSVWSKGIAGLVETVGGLLLLFIPQTGLNALVIFLTAPELAEDPTDRVATLLRRLVHEFPADTKLFVSAYLLVHGLIKLFLVGGLLRGKLWSYPLSLWFLAVFIVYQCYRFTYTRSVWLVLLTVLDLIVAFLIWREYQQVQKLKPLKARTREPITRCNS